MSLKIKRNKLLIRKYTSDTIQILIGAIIMACGISLFLLPNQLSSGGFTGVATITYYLFKFPMGTAILVLNIPLFIMAYFRLGKEIFFKAILGTVFLSIFIDIFDKFQPLTTDRFLACIYGGIIIGLGTAIILKANGSSGGTELSTLVIRSYKPHYRISSLLVILDIIIIGLNVVVFREIEIGLYSAITIYLMGKIVDVFFEGIYFTKLIFIVTKESEKVAKIINDKIGRGVTGLFGKGMYTGSEKTILMCAATRGDVVRIREITQNIDPYSFIIIANSREVFGQGFKKR